MGNHLVRNENNNNIIRTTSDTDITPSDKLTKFFVEVMKFQKDLDKEGKDFYLNQRRACCMGVTKDKNKSININKKAIAINMPYYIKSEAKCPINYVKENDKYKMGTNIITQDEYNKLKVEDCVGYKKIAMAFDINEEDCKHNGADYFVSSFEGTTDNPPNVSTCASWMKWHCSKAVFNQGCLNIKLNDKGEKIRSTDINKYGCGEYNERTKKFENNTAPQYEECGCLNDFTGYTYRTDPGGDASIFKYTPPYPLDKTQLDPNNVDSVYSLNINNLPIPIKPTSQSGFCNKKMLTWQNHGMGRFRAFLNASEREPKVEVNCINIMQFKNIDAKEINMSGINQVNNCGSESVANKKIQEDNNKFLGDMAKEGTNQASTTEQEKITKEAEKIQRTNDAKENAALNIAKEKAKDDKKLEETEEKKIKEEKQNLIKEVDKLTKLKEELDKKNEILNQIDPEPIQNNSTILDSTNLNDNLILYLGGGVVILLVLILIIILMTRGNSSKN